jgi:hypothetical protein
MACSSVDMKLVSPLTRTICIWVVQIQPAASPTFRPILNPCAVLRSQDLHSVDHFHHVTALPLRALPKDAGVRTVQSLHARWYRITVQDHTNGAAQRQVLTVRFLVFAKHTAVFVYAANIIHTPG